MSVAASAAVTARERRPLSLHGKVLWFPHSEERTHCSFSHFRVTYNERYIFAQCHTPRAGTRPFLLWVCGRHSRNPNLAAACDLCKRP